MPAPQPPSLMPPPQSVSVQQGLKPVQSTAGSMSYNGEPGVQGLVMGRQSTANGGKRRRVGSRTCQKEGCEKVSLTGGHCAAHGGGSRCRMLGCDKIDIGGGHCATHGGGVRCRWDGCSNVSQGKGRFCRLHGGGRRCTMPRCFKVDVGRGLCRRHGGGR
ncbi:unnamed protein product, partial [Discosporangium mesarthrocarpum]